jgi:Skp family chaperone for outer membrane proteins
MSLEILILLAIPAAAPTVAATAAGAAAMTVSASAIVAGALATAVGAIAAKTIVSAPEQDEQVQAKLRAEQTRIPRLNAAKKREADALRQSLSELGDERTRTELTQALESAVADLNQDAVGAKWQDVTEVISRYEDVRSRILQAKQEEREELFLRVALEEKTRFWETSDARGKLPGFESEYEKIRLELGSDALKGAKQSERLHQLSRLEHRLAVFLAKAEKASDTDISGLEEEKMPVVIPTVPESADRAAQIGKLKDDIGAYFSQIFHLDEKEAEKAAPLYREAMTCDVEIRLDVIRGKLKRDCANLRHEKFLTEYFRSDLTNALNSLINIDPDTPLTREAQKILASEKITREQYCELSLKFVRAAQTAAEKSLRAEIAGTVQEVLSSFGYTLVQNEGESAAANRHRFYESTQKDYRVEIDIADTGKMAARLVRVVGDESEKKSQSFVQKQKDTEAAKKWCSVSHKVEEELAAHGFQLDFKRRIEPEDEGWELPVLVDAKLSEAQTARAKRTTPREHARRT